MGLWGSLAILARLGRVDSGSNPGSPIKKGVWLNWLPRPAHNRKIAGSSPVAPIPHLMFHNIGCGVSGK